MTNSISEYRREHGCDNCRYHSAQGARCLHPHYAKVMTAISKQEDVLSAAGMCPGFRKGDKPFTKKRKAGRKEAGSE